MPNDSGPVIAAQATDADRAKVYKDRIRPLLEQAAAIVDEARREGLRIEFAIGGDAYGRSMVQHINIVKPL